MSLLVERIGFLKGAVARHVPGGFEIELGGGEDERIKLEAKIVWLKQHHRRLAVDKRASQRWHPRVATTRLYFADQTEHDCFVIDVSATGAGLSAQVRPPVGTRLEVGQVPCTVARHFAEGFAIAFDAAYPAKRLEEMLTRRREPAVGLVSQG